MCFTRSRAEYLPDRRLGTEPAVIRLVSLECEGMMIQVMKQEEQERARNAQVVRMVTNKGEKPG